MTNGMEKSDVGNSSCEASEQRERQSRRSRWSEGPSPRGNPGGQSTRRTQDRESVSQAADRIREFVQREPRERLTALLHHVTVDALRWAFFELKKECGGGRGWRDVADVRGRTGRPVWPTCTTACTRERTGRRHRDG